MTEKELELYIDELGTKGTVLGLDTMKDLMERTGNPQNACRYVHIAGTNGKGSVLQYVSTILRTAGYKVGCFFSPALRDPWEKIQVNGKKISRTAVRRYMEKIRDVSKEMEAENRNTPTLFEAECAVAFMYFADRACDFVVLEVGMGGKTDATNVIPAPDVAALTRISMDHAGILGNTMEEIADVKSGIIKNGCRVVSTIQEEDVRAVIRRAAGKKGAKSLVFAEVPEKIRYGKTFTAFTYKGAKYKVSLHGVCQPENAALALEAVFALKQNGVKIEEECILRGLAQTRWEGRFQFIGNKPRYVFDGAHNEEAAKRLRESLEMYFADRPLIFVMGVLKDKEYDKIVGILSPLMAHLITLTPPHNPRALTSWELAVCAREYLTQVTRADSLEEALEIAELLAGDKCTVVVCGSLSFLGEAIDIVKRGKGKGKQSKR